MNNEKIIKNIAPSTVAWLTIFGVGVVIDMNLPAMIITSIGMIVMVIVCAIIYVIYGE